MLDLCPRHVCFVDVDGLQNAKVIESKQVLALCTELAIPRRDWIKPNCLSDHLTRGRVKLPDTIHHVAVSNGIWPIESVNSLADYTPCMRPAI
ncbi:MAG: hypothetical protein AAFU85_09245 [Planctomycetota bacterium]